MELLKLAEKIADYEVEEYSKEFLAQKIDRIEQAISRHSQKLASQYRVGDRYPAESSKEDRWLSAQREKHMRWCQENGLDPTKNSFFGINRGVDLYGIKGEFKGEPLELIYDSDEGITIKIVGQEYSSSIDDQENVKKFQDLYDKFRPYIEYESNDLWEAKFALQQDVKKFKDEQIDLAFQDIKF